jgi:excinuclease ABC subunit B
MAFNVEQGITPRSVTKQVRELIDGVVESQSDKSKLRSAEAAARVEAMSEKDLGKRIKALERQMLEYARNLEFEQAARVRDQLSLLREQAFGASVGAALPPPTTAPRKDAP